MAKSQKYVHCLFCDESGDLANVNTQYLIGAVVITDNPSALRQDVMRTKKNARPSIGKGIPLHAADQKLDVSIDLIKRVIKREDVFIAVAILDKQWIWNRSADDNVIYNQFIAHLIQHGLAISGNITPFAKVILERRYTQNKHHFSLIEQVANVADLDEDQVIVATKTDHHWGECLQVADVIAWSMYQKYEKGDLTFFNLFKDKLETEINLGINGEGAICSIASMNNAVSN